jgi:hypothetical protein
LLFHRERVSDIVYDSESIKHAVWRSLRQNYLPTSCMAAPQAAVSALRGQALSGQIGAEQGPEQSG